MAGVTQQAKKKSNEPQTAYHYIAISAGLVAESQL